MMHVNVAMIQFGLLLAFLGAVNSSGFVEILLAEYDNPSGILADGTCCSESENVTAVCPGLCDTTVNVCLQPFRQNSKKYLDSDSCLYGSRSLVSGFTGNSFRNHHDATVRIDFQFSWPGAVTVIFELKHVLKRAMVNQMKYRLIHRSVESMKMDSLSAWRSVTSENERDVSLLYRMRVVCDQFYYGPSCNVNCKPNDSDKGHYSCSDAGLKTCNPGWTGPNCNSPICEQPCQHGSCNAPNTCKCEYGWRGDNCGECTPYEGCSHGFCRKPFECLCEERWGGLQCDVDMDYCMHHQPCQNGATCDPHAPNNYTCICEHGFAGRNCEIKVSSCWINPCLNFGTCTVIKDIEGNNGYKCVCDELHHGTHCEFPRNAQKKGSDGGKPQPTENSCFHQGTYHPHQSRWDTMDCRQCNCVQGTVNCSAAACMSENCLATGDNTFNQQCPSNQVCESVTSATCLQQPCHLPYGQCKPWYLLDDASKKDVCLGENSGEKARKCATIYARFDPRKLPKGATAERVCYHVLLVLLTRGLDQYSTSCKLISNRNSALVVQVDLFSIGTWPVDGLKGILVELLNQNLTASPVLRAISQVTEAAHGTGKPTDVVPEKESGTNSISYIAALVLILMSLCCCIAAIVALLVLIRKRLHRGFLRSGDLNAIEENRRNNLYLERNVTKDMPDLDKKGTVYHNNLTTRSPTNSDITYMSELEPEDKFTPQVITYPPTSLPKTKVCNLWPHSENPTDIPLKNMKAGVKCKGEQKAEEKGVGVLPPRCWYTYEDRFGPTITPPMEAELATLKIEQIEATV